MLYYLTSFTIFRQDSWKTSCVWLQNELWGSFQIMRQFGGSNPTHFKRGKFSVARILDTQILETFYNHDSFWPRHGSFMYANPWIPVHNGCRDEAFLWLRTVKNCAYSLKNQSKVLQSYCLGTCLRSTIHSWYNMKYWRNWWHQCYRS